MLFLIWPPLRPRSSRRPPPWPSALAASGSCLTTRAHRQHLRRCHKYLVISEQRASGCGGRRWRRRWWRRHGHLRLLSSEPGAGGGPGDEGDCEYDGCDEDVFDGAYASGDASGGCAGGAPVLVSDGDASRELSHELPDAGGEGDDRFSTTSSTTSSSASFDVGGAPPSSSAQPGARSPASAPAPPPLPTYGAMMPAGSASSADNATSRLLLRRGVRPTLGL